MKKVILLVVFVLTACSNTNPIKNTKANSEKHSQYNDASYFKPYLYDKLKGVTVHDGMNDLLSPSRSTKLITTTPLFNSGKWTIRKEASPLFKKLANTLIKNDQIVVVTGHTDASGDKFYNENISLMRAKSIAKLLHKFGVNKNKILYKGLGETNLISKSKTTSANKINRRVELNIFDEFSEVKKQRANVKPNTFGFTFYLMEENYAEDYFSKKKTSKSSKFFTPKINFGGTRIKSKNNQLLAKINLQNTSVDIEDIAQKFNKDCSINKSQTALVPIKTSLHSAYNFLNLNGNVWFSTSANGKKFSLIGLALNRDGEGILKPLIYISENGKTLYKNTPEHIDAVIGENNVLVRMVFDINAPMSCIDIVFSQDAQRVSKDSVVYYRKGYDLFEQKFTLIRAK